jgi:hypothetical protein
MANVLLTRASSVLGVDRRDEAAYYYLVQRVPVVNPGNMTDPLASLTTYSFKERPKNPRLRPEQSLSIGLLRETYNHDISS